MKTNDRHQTKGQLVDMLQEQLTLLGQVLEAGVTNDEDIRKQHQLMNALVEGIAATN